MIEYTIMYLNYRNVLTSFFLRWFRLFKNVKLSNEEVKVQKKLECWIAKGKKIREKKNKHK